MNKNKLIRIFALFSIIIASLPIAYAQSFVGSNLYFILVNSAIAGIILFILQTILLPQKDGKEKTAVYVGIALGSLLIGFLFGQSGYLWEGYFARYFDVHVLVNTVLIASVLYFILGLMKVNDLKSPEGKGGYLFIIIVVSLLFAVKAGPNWIWQVGVIKEIVDYFFGAGGILVPPQLFVFIASFALMAYFFEGYLSKNIPGGKFINYGLAFVLAVSMARAGVGFPLVIKIGELVFLIIIADALKGQELDGKYQWGLAFLLVGWASASMTAVLGPGNEGIIGGFMSPMLRYYGLIPTTASSTVGFSPFLLSPPVLIMVAIFVAMDIVSKPDSIWKKIGAGGIITWGLLFIFSGGLSFGFGNWGKIGLIFLIIIGLVILVFFGIARGEGRAGILREGVTRLWVKLLQKLRRNRSTAKIVGDYFEMRDPTLPDELPFVLKDLRLEIYTLMNFTLRHEIYKAKSASMKREFLGRFGGDRGRELVMGDNIPTSESIHNSIKSLVEGSEIKKTDDGRGWVLTDESRGVGFARQYFLIYKVMEMLRDMLESDLTGAPPTNPAQDVESFTANMKSTFLDGHIKHIDNIYNTRYKTSVERFKVVNLVRAYRLYFLDMYNMYGKYTRGYGFAKLNAKPDYYTYNKSDNDITKSIDFDTGSPYRPKFDNPETGDVKNYESGTDNLVEVNLYGFSTSDINAIQIGRIDLPYIRRYKKGDIVYLHKEETGKPRFNEIINYASKDWDFYVEDLERGIYHPYTKSITDYNELVSHSYLKFSAATFKKPLTIEEIGFDREALKNPGSFVYWGRKNYYDETRDSLRQEPVNPYPIASLIGLWQFIGDVAKKRIKEPAAAEKFLTDYFRMGYEDLQKATGERK